MQEKLSGVFMLLVVVIFLGVFVLYMILFSPGSRRDFRIEIPSKIMGISTDNGKQSNFELPEDITYESVDLLGSDVEEKIVNSGNSNDSYSLGIEKISLVNEKIEKSNSLDTLQETGWLLLPWTYESETSFLDFLPWTKEKAKGEAIIVCYRRFYGSSNPNSCVNLHKLLKGDKIVFDGFEYSVLKTSMVKSSQETIFDASDSEYLKIITNTGDSATDTTGNSHYIVVVAEKISL